MADEIGSASGAEEYVIAEIELEEALNPEQEKDLRDSFEKIGPQTFESWDIAPSKVSIRYDPARTNLESLLGVIRKAGGKLKHVESESSPLL
jgi:copper chaperone CopZ